MSPSALHRLRCAHLALGLSLPLTAAGCDDAGPPASEPAPAVSAWDTVAAPRRPATSYFLIRAGAACWIYAEHGEERATRSEALCPRDLRDGERIALLGHVCMRQGGGPERDVPVRCPKPLLYGEYFDRVDAGLAQP